MIFVRKENEDWFWNLVESADEVAKKTAVEDCAERLEKSVNSIDNSIEDNLRAMNALFLAKRALEGKLPAMSEVYTKALTEGAILINSAGGYHYAGDQEFVETVEAESWEALRELKK
jgi:hypothetical protein